MSERPEIHLERGLDAPVERLEDVLRAGPERWVPGFADDGGRTTAVLRYQQGGRHIERTIEVEVGPVQRFAYGVSVRLDWRAARHSELYPELEGHLRVERKDPAGARLRFDARYAPPAGQVGAVVDRAVMHRVARASLEDFVDRVTAALDAAAAGPGPRR